MTSTYQRRRAVAGAGALVLALAGCGVGRAQTATAPGSRTPALASADGFSTTPSPGGEPLRDGLSVATRTRLAAPIGMTGEGAGTAWYAVLVVDRGVDSRLPLATLATQAQQTGYALSHRGDSTVELVGQVSSMVRTLRLGAVAAQGDVPAYVQVVVTTSPRTGP